MKPITIGFLTYIMQSLKDDLKEQKAKILDHYTVDQYLTDPTVPDVVESYCLTTDMLQTNLHHALNTLIGIASLTIKG